MKQALALGAPNAVSRVLPLSIAVAFSGLIFRRKRPAGKDHGILPEHV